VVPVVPVVPDWSHELVVVVDWSVEVVVVLDFVDDVVVVRVVVVVPMPGTPPPVPLFVLVP